MEFPTIVYRCPGEHFAHDGATYKYKPANDKEAFDELIAEGWHGSLVDAVKAFKEPKKSNDVVIPADDNSPPTREEMEAKAKELGIKFDGRTSDSKLRNMIEEKL